MRSNSLDFSSFETMPMPAAPKKTERSHEENQERAYIAASRRTDRSLEARVQSARMASDIHKRRTGKSFRITDDIVMKEEMYEEEDDDLPRSYRVLGPHMKTSSSELNYRAGAYFSNRVALSELVALQHARTFSTSAVSQCSPQHPEFLRQDSGVALPGSPPTFHHSPHPDSPMDLGSNRSAFTAELPSEARMMMMSGVDMNAGYDSASQTWPSMDATFDMPGVPRGSRNEEEQVVSPTSDTFDISNLRWDPMMAQVDDSTWNTFINDNAWTDGQ
ncbi:hypothetical protein CRV24_001959 [Beauveria bassiana]|nr:hypothetical protein CRV24_001959 [Beauveria bassiana]